MKGFHDLTGWGDEAPGTAKKRRRAASLFAEVQISARMASPMPEQPTQVQPSLMLSAVRMPLSSTLLTAFSMASASSARPKE